MIPTALREIIQTRYLRNILIISLLTAVLLIIADILIIYPAFIRFAIKSTEDESAKIGEVMSHLIPTNAALSKDELPLHTLNQIKWLAEEIGLMKLKIFNNSGEVIYSTDEKDIGIINKEPYFRERALKEKLSKFVKKNSKTYEGEEISIDVVETYIPIMKGGKTIGVFEIYYDITDKQKELKSLLFSSWAFISILAISLLTAIFLVLHRASREIASRGNVEAELRNARDTLEQRVGDRTAELVQTNERLLSEINERRQAETALHESEETYRNILENMEEGYFRVDLAGNFTFFNKALQGLLGYSAEEIMGLNNRVYMNEENAEKVYRAYNRLYESGVVEKLDYEIIRPSGQVRYVESVFSLIYDGDNQPAGFSGVVHDITDRKLAEENFKRTSTRLSSLLESLPTIPYTCKADGDMAITYISSAIEDVLGYSPVQIESDSSFWIDHIHPGDKSRVIQEMEILLQQDRHNFEYGFMAADGSYKMISDTRCLVRTPDGSLSHIVGTLQDNTERQRQHSQKVHSPLSMHERGFGDLIGTSAPMQEIYERISRIIEKDVKTVLILGETGTGKDLVAETIHHQSPRAPHPMVEINCAGIPENLLESELFGHEKGAFTDATELKRGLFEEAPMGTILLNEIGHMRLDLQAKLLRVLEERKFRRVGGVKDLDVDVRIVAATNKGLWEAVQTGEFREDLYYRLKLVPLYMPPLRDRKSDLPLLIEHLIQSANQQFEKNITGVTSEAEELLMQYDWPGNVRELRNIIERAVIFCEDDFIDVDHMPREITAAENSTPFVFELPPSGISLADVERQLIEQALDVTGGNQIQASKLLNITRHAMRHRMKKHGLL